MTPTMWFVAIAAVLAAVGSSDSLEDLNAICVKDIAKVCTNEHELIPLMTCLSNHRAGLSSNCKEAVEKCPAFACSGDLIKLCPQARNHHEFVKCMHQHREQLSPSCPYSKDEFRMVDKGCKCKEDRQKFCSDVHGLIHVMKCMKDHHDELTSDCAAAIDHCPAFKCIDDALKFCPDAETHHDFTSCLWKHRAEISSECKVHEVRVQQTTDFDKLDHSCKADRAKLCSGETKLVPIMTCLAKNEPSLSASCKKAIDSCPGFGCVDDASKFCPDVATQHDFISCIWNHRNELSPKCKQGRHGGWPSPRSTLRRFGNRAAIHAGLLDSEGDLTLHPNYIRAAVLGTTGSILLTVMGMVAWRRYRRKEVPEVEVQHSAEYRRM